MSSQKYSSVDAALQHSEEMLRRLDALEQENGELGKELLRCYEQLNLVFEITEKISTLTEPDTIRAALLKRCASMLSATTWLIRPDGGCAHTESAGEPAALPLDPSASMKHLKFVAAEVRRTHRAVVPTLDADAAAALQQAHVLIGPLRSIDECWLIVALRGPAQPHFESGDMLAVESVLGYGEHVLNNILMGQRLQQTAIETIRALVTAIDAKDNYTSGHSERVGWLARMTGEALGLPKEELELLEWGGLLHDVGKIGVPEAILNKPGRLTEREFAAIRKHPEIGYEVLKPVKRFERVLDAVLYHHENHDGSGYPRGLKGHDIPLPARITHVVDIFDALTSSRSYRRGFTIQKAIAILHEEAGRVTDPVIANTFIEAFARYRQEQPADFAWRFAHLADESSGGET